MTTPTSTTGPTRRRVSALIVGAALLAGGAGVMQATSALWSDTATATFDADAATFELTIDGVENITIPASTLDNLAPGNERTFTFVLRNGGSIPGTLSLSTATTGSAPLAGALSFELSDITGAPVSLHTSTLTSGAKALASNTAFAAGQSKTYEVKVIMDPAAPDSLIGTTLNSVLSFTLTQA